jgi:hypothetical protein
MAHPLRIATKVAALALLLGPLALRAPAGFNTAPNMPQRATYQTFLAGGFSPVNGGLSLTYNTGGNHPVTGTFTSQTFKSGNTYAYLYQVSIANTTVNTKNLILSYKITPWTGAFLNFTLGNVGSHPVYQIDSLGKNQPNTSAFTFFQGLKRTDSAQGVDNSFLLANFINSLSNGLRRGTTSTILVAFSNRAPRIANSHITVGGSGTGSADVAAYAPVVPEPSSLVMLALGGVGALGLPLWRRRRPAPS